MKFFSLNSTRLTVLLSAIVLIIYLFAQCPVSLSYSFDQDLNSKNCITWARGEKVKIRGISSLEPGTKLTLTSDPPLSTLFEDVNDVEYLYVGADGVFEREFVVRSDAPETVYKLKISYNELSDYALVKVIGQKLSCQAKSIDNGVIEVVRGGKIRISGTTTVDYIVVCASANDVFEGVKKVKEGKFSINGHKIVTVVDGCFNFTIKVKESADPGYYNLFLFAPSRDITRCPFVDPMEDIVKIYTIHVKNPKIIPIWAANISDNNSSKSSNQVEFKIFNTESNCSVSNTAKRLVLWI